MKIDRLFAITNILINKKTVTATELASQFGVSVRTIYRDVEILSTNGVPIYTHQGKGGGISIMEGYTIDRTMLSDEEQKQVLLALQSLQVTRHIDVDSSINKLRNVFKKDNTNWIEIDFAGWEESDGEKEIFELVKDGILHSATLSFSYYGNNGEKSERVVEPHKLIYKGYSWYLYAYCRLRKDFRFFKLRRMENLSVSEESHFQNNTPASISKTSDSNNSEEKYKVTLKIDASMAFRIYDEFRNGVIKNCGEYFMVEILLPDKQWVYSYLLGFGSALEVLEPKQYRDRCIEELKKSLKKYL